jgi:hypothetical protein
MTAVMAVTALPTAENDDDFGTVRNATLEDSSCGISAMTSMN